VNFRPHYFPFQANLGGGCPTLFFIVYEQNQSKLTTQDLTPVFDKWRIKPMSDKMSDKICLNARRKV